MPNRIIRESCRTSPTLALLSAEAERLFWRLTTYADDHGAFEAGAAILRGACLPHFVSVKLTQIDRWMVELEQAELVDHHRVNGKLFGKFRTWDKHQRIRAVNSKYPPLTLDSRCPRMLSNVPVVGSTGVQESRVQESDASGSGGEPPPTAAERPATLRFAIPASVSEALTRAPLLGQVAKLRDPLWWQAELRANPGVDLAAEVLKAEAWMRTNPSRAPKSDLARFMHSWLRRADREPA